MKIKKSDIKKWCAALDSGEYNQTKCTLQDHDGYCCLGVACKIFIPKDKQQLYENTLIGSLPYDQIMAPHWISYLVSDFEKNTNSKLQDLNDNEDFTFSEIATLLELVYIHEILKK
jgi:hypothetical protein